MLRKTTTTSLIAAILGSLAVALLLCGCATREIAASAPTPWPTPVVPDEPTYMVQRGTVIDSFQVAAQVSPVEYQVEIVSGLRDGDVVVGP